MQNLSDNYHMGHLLLETFRKRSDQDIFLINGDTDEKVSYKSMLQSSIRLARALKEAGLQPGDILALAGPNSANGHVPFYAAMYVGLPLCGMAASYTYEELRNVLEFVKPKIAFVDCNLVEQYHEVKREFDLDMIVVAIEKISEFIEEFDDNSATSDFKPNVFNIENIPLWLIATSGSTGSVKKFAVCKQGPVYKRLFCSNRYPTENSAYKTCLKLSTFTWVSGYGLTTLIPIYNFTTLITTRSDEESIINAINKYRPQLGMIGSFLLPSLLSGTKCDFTCFETLIFGGAVTFDNHLKTLKKRARRDLNIIQVYGLTETIGHILATKGDCFSCCCGRPCDPDVFKFKLVDTETEKEITELNIPGELWFKGPMMSEYYKNPTATKEVITADGWLKTGDLMYRDEEGNYFFVARMKMLVKLNFYKKRYIFSGTELENVISSHPGVLEVCVTVIPHEEELERLVAVVVPKKESGVTARDIKELVAENLPEWKHLRGGVVFIEALPKLSNGKPARSKISQIATTSFREH
ncbi:AMP-binding enzyme domain-containing protein [Phthorimaea operculella]|nr:AMP-binding enzyme domain-containing protein [Phthorimaea operculella]